MFADDTTITAFGQTINSVCINLQSDLDSIQSWCNRNSMMPNAQKTKAMFISPSSHIYNTISNSNNFSLTLQDEIIQFSKSEKLLGVHVDHTLNWKTHVKMALNKCNSLLYLLMRIKQFLNLHVRKMFFNAYILPHLDYCCTIWGIKSS